MNRMITVLATIVVASSLVFAQGGGQRGGFRMGGPAVLSREDVAKELKLTSDQQASLQKIFEEMRPQGGGPGAGGGGGGQRGAGGGQRAAELEAKIKTVLNEAQFKRYQELALQQAGGMSLNREDIQKALNLSDAQKQSIADLNASMREDMQGLFGGSGDREEAMKQMQKLRADYGKDMLKVLNGEQTKAWEAMLGKPFKFQD